LIDGDVMGKGTFMAFGIHHQWGGKWK
jgi:hypothetical protein